MWFSLSVCSFHAKIVCWFVFMPKLFGHSSMRLLFSFLLTLHQLRKYVDLLVCCRLVVRFVAKLLLIFLPFSFIDLVVDSLLNLVFVSFCCPQQRSGPSAGKLRVPLPPLVYLGVGVPRDVRKDQPGDVGRSFQNGPRYA